MSRLHRADDPYASDVVAYVTLRIRLSSRPVEKYPPFGAAAVVDDDDRHGDADQGILRVRTVMARPPPWIAGSARNA